MVYASKEDLVNSFAASISELVQVVLPIKDGTFVRIKLLNLESATPKVITLKMDLTYWWVVVQT